MNNPEHARTGETVPAAPDSTPDVATGWGSESSATPDAGVAASGPNSHSDSDATVAIYRPLGDPTADDVPGPVGDAQGGSLDDGHGAAVQALRHRTARRRKAKKRPWWVELPILLVTAFLLTFLIQTFLFKVYYVPSGSMEQTLHGVESGGDRILVNKIVYDFADPAPGDVVVFKGPPTWAPEASIPGPSSWIGKVGQLVGSVVGIAPANEKDFVKRVIAVGGQTIMCCDNGGNIVVDGVSLDESAYVYEPIPFEPGVIDCTTPDKSQRCFGPFTVPADNLWMMGDHRSHSADSTAGCQGGRELEFCQGPVPVDDVIGKAIFIVMPISRWDTIGDPKIDHRPGN